MSNEREKTKKEEVTEKTTEEQEEYLVKYKSGPNKLQTKQGNVYNINIQIGQPPVPPYKP